MAGWKKALLVLSLILGVAGLAYGGLGLSGDGPSESARSSQTGEFGVQSFDGGQNFGEGSLESEADETPLWAPLLAKGGLSFFLAFCIGYALRTFLKGTMLVIGVVALAIFGLQKAGIIGEIDWSRAQGYWDGLTENIGEQFESLKAFVTGSLPSAASGTVGLVAGFRR